MMFYRLVFGGVTKQTGEDMIEAVIFDMDGLLIDSEPMWKMAEKRVFTSLGIEISDVLARKTATMTTREVTEFWYDQRPWSGKSIEEVEEEVISEVKRQVLSYGKEMLGVGAILRFLKQRGVAIGLATNSPSKLIPVVLDQLKIADFFDAVSSSEYEEKGKPAPGVYLSTAKKMGKDPSVCLAFEDSFSGLTAAKEAGMKTVVVPCLDEYADMKFEIADLKLRTLADFDQGFFKLLNQ